MKWAWSVLNLAAISLMIERCTTYSLKKGTLECIYVWQKSNALIVRHQFMRLFVCLSRKKCPCNFLAHTLRSDLKSAKHTWNLWVKRQLVKLFGCQLIKDFSFHRKAIFNKGKSPGVPFHGVTSQYS